MGGGRRSSLAAILVLLLVGAACAPTAATPGAASPSASASGAAAAVPSGAPYKLGMSAGLSVSAVITELGKANVDGARAAVEWVNTHGGVNGRPLQLNVADDQGANDLAVANYRKFAADGSVAVLGLLSTAQNAAALPFVADGIPMISGAAPGSAVTAPQKNAFFTWLTLDDGMRLMVGAADQYAKQNNKPNLRVAIFSLTSPAVTAATEYAVNAIKANGWTLVSNIVYQPTTTEFSALAQQLADAKPDLILGQFPSVLAVAPALVKFGINAPVINYPSGSSAILFKQMGDQGFKSYQGVRWLVPLTDTSAAAVGEINQMVAKLGIPQSSLDNDVWFSTGWVEAMVAATALDKCPGECAPADFAKSMEKISGLKADGLIPNGLSFSSTSHNGINFGRIYGLAADGKTLTPVSDWLEVKH
jgi:ABC-type branched-subunit amino acid transport system substrate-binding protein